MNEVKIIELVDDECRGVLFELLSTADIDGKQYALITPHVENGFDRMGIVGMTFVMQVFKEDGKPSYGTVEEFENYNEVFTILKERYTKQYEDMFNFAY